MQPIADQANVRATDAPQPPSSGTWKVELAVAMLGLVAGLAAALVFLT